MLPNQLYVTAVRTHT